MDDPGGARSIDEALHRGNGLLGAGDVELPVRKHEVDLSVDVPENGHVDELEPPARLVRTAGLR